MSCRRSWIPSWGPSPQEAVQDERRLTIGVTTLQRVKGAVRQLESDVFDSMCVSFFQEWSDERC